MLIKKYENEDEESGTLLEDLSGKFEKETGNTNNDDNG